MIGSLFDTSGDNEVNILDTFAHPLPDSAPAPEETPILEETPIRDEMPIPEEIPIPEETPTPAEQVQESQPVLEDSAVVADTAPPAVKSVPPEREVTSLPPERSSAPARTSPPTMTSRPPFYRGEPDHARNEYGSFNDDVDCVGESSVRGQQGSAVDGRGDCRSTIDGHESVADGQQVSGYETTGDAEYGRANDDVNSVGESNAHDQHSSDDDGHDGCKSINENVDVSNVCRESVVDDQQVSAGDATDNSNKLHVSDADALDSGYRPHEE